jgi:hypothetical protein
MSALITTNEEPFADYCEVCQAKHNLGRMTFPGNVSFTVCAPCNKNPAKIKNWLIHAFGETLKANSNFAQLPDGRWQRKHEREAT